MEKFEFTDTEIITLICSLNDRKEICEHFLEVFPKDEHTYNYWSLELSLCDSLLRRIFDGGKDHD